MTATERRRADAAVGRLLGQGMAYSVATAIQGGVAVVALPAVTRSVEDAAQYGAIAAALVVLQLVSTFASLGLPAALTREYYESTSAREAAAGLIGTAAVFASLIAIAVHLSGPWWSRAFASLEYEGALPLAVAAVVPIALLAAGQALLRCREQAALFVAATVVGTAGAQLLGLAALWTGEPTAARFFLGFLVGVSLGAGVAIAGVGVRHLRPAPRQLTESALRLGMPTLPHVMALYLVMAADRVIVERFEGLAAAGRYQFTYLLGMVGVSLLVAVNNAWVPVVYAEENPKERWEVLARTTDTLLRLSVPIVCGLAIGAPILLRIAAPASFDPAELAPVLVLAALSLVPYVLYLAAAMVVFYERRSGLLAMISPTVAGFNLAANWVVVPRWGLVGAALVSLLSYVLLAGLALAASRRLVPVPWPGTNLTTAIAAGLLGGAVALVLPVDGGWLVLRAVLGAGCLALLGHAARGAARG